MTRKCHPCFLAHIPLSTLKFRKLRYREGLVISSVWEGGLNQFYVDSRGWEASADIWKTWAQTEECSLLSGGYLVDRWGQKKRKEWSLSFMLLFSIYRDACILFRWFIDLSHSSTSLDHRFTMLYVCQVCWAPSRRLFYGWKTNL